RVREPAHLLCRRLRVRAGCRDRHFHQPSARPRAGGARRPHHHEMGADRRRPVARLKGTPAMLWVKTLHILFVIAWFAGLFYLPRIYVNLAQTNDAAAYDCLVGMARRLYRFMTPLDRKSTRLNSSHVKISYAVFCLKKKKKKQ